MAKKKISKEKSIRRAKHLTEFALCALAVAAGFYIIKGMVDRSDTVRESDFYDKTDIPEQTTSAPVEPADPNKIIFETFTAKTKDTYRGDLILVNEDHQYFDGDEDLVSILEKNDEAGRKSFTAVDYDYKIIDVAYEPMAQMIDSFVAATELDDLMIYGSYRTREFQKQLYENDLAIKGTESSDLVAKPGHSEHETGYAFDFSRYEKGTGAPVDYDGTGEYAWFSENCYKYGFIMRYPEEKKEITKIKYEPWHFRYVGIPHAYYMTNKGICLEEYIDLVREHPYEGDHLEFSDHNGKNYEVYFVTSVGDTESDTSIPVPTGLKYEISGNNVDGFIVTVYKDEKSNGTVNSTVTDTATTAPSTEETTAVLTTEEAAAE